MEKKRDEKSSKDKLERTVVLVIRCILFPLAAVAGFSFGGGHLNIGSYFAIAWIVLGYILYGIIISWGDKLDLPMRIIADAIVKSVIIGSLLFTVLGFGGFYKIKGLMFSLLIAPFLLFILHTIFNRSEKRERLPSYYDYIVLSTIVAWAVEAMIYVLAEGKSYNLGDLGNHGVSLTVAGFFWMVAIAFLGAHGGTSLYQEVRTIVRGHVEKTTLEELKKNLPIEIQNGYISVLRCYHSTSLLFGFWLDPLAKKEDKINVLTYALRKANVPVTVELVGPSPIVLDFLIISRLHALMLNALDKNGKLKSSPGKKWCSFLNAIYEDNKQKKIVVGPVLSTQLLSKPTSDNWWYMLDILRWYLLNSYYSLLMKYYRDLPEKLNFKVVECTRYDPVIREALTDAVEQPEDVVFENCSVTSGGPSPILHVKGLGQWKAKRTCLVNAIDAMDRLFFPEYAFAILSPKPVHIQTGTYSKSLLCHNVLNTLAFSCLRSQPTSILRLMHNDLLVHYEEAFNPEWKPRRAALTNSPERMNPVYLNLEKCRNRWSALSKFALTKFKEAINYAEENTSESQG
ncbi:MAG: GlsB/YeaQ/YmgE family stress response membrane protein [Phycisphaerae bacterium]|nr:GlsB/YeaQ/YmgE family stress response membrane protein [Phycisphaerae bacterium]